MNAHKFPQFGNLEGYKSTNVSWVRFLNIHQKTGVMKTTITTEHETGVNATEVVTSFIRSLNDENFEAARKLISDNVKFIGVMGIRDGGDVYIDEMTKMKFKYRIDKVFSDKDDVSVWYSINMSGTEIPCAGLYTVASEKIEKIIVLFDPRPILKMQN